MHRLPALVPALTLLLSITTSAHATDVPIVGLKLTIVDATVDGKAKVVFVAKDAAITKGSGSDRTQIEASLDVDIDGRRGTFVMPSGANWLVSSPVAGKYVNKASPAGGAVKSGVVKAGGLMKVVAKSLGDTPIDITSAPSGHVYVAATILNGGEETRLCTQFSACTHKTSADGSKFKLVCKGSSAGDADCTALAPACASAPEAPVGGSYSTCTPPVRSGAACVLACADGYSKTGVDPICEHGTFMGNASCTPATCASLDESSITSDCGSAPTGSQCTLQCAPFTHRSDGGVGTTTTATCTGVAPGESAWAHPAFTCTPNLCLSELSAPTGGSYPTCTPPVASGTTCPLVCAPGYTKVGTDPTCSFGSFTGSGLASCVAATCATLESLPSVVSNCGSAPTGSQCTLQCAAGTHRSDGGSGATVTATCTGVGAGTSAWSHPTFACAPDPCPLVPPPPAHGSYPGCSAPVPSGTTCELVCAPGYTKSGTDPVCFLGAFTALGMNTCTPDP